MLFIYRYLVPFPNPKAHSVQIANTIHALARAGAEVHFYPQEYTEPSLEACLARYGLTPHPNLKLCRHPQWTKRSRQWKGALIRIWEGWRFGRLKRRNPVFYLRDGEDSFAYAQRLAEKRTKWNARVVIECHRVHKMELDEYSRPDAKEHERQKLKTGLNRLSRQEPRGLRSCDGVVTISETLRRSLRETYAELPPTEVVHSGASLPPEPDTSLSERRGIVYAGQLYAWKGVPTLLKAMAALPDCQLTVVGGNNPDELAGAKNLASEYGVGKRVHFTGHVPPGEVRRYILQARCAVVPLGLDLLARKFTSPIKIFEYMACGAPIVASDLPTVREVLRHEENALLCSPESPESLSAQIQRVMTDDDLAQTIRQQARDDLDDYSWDKRAQNIIQFARRLTGGDGQYAP